MRETKDPAVRRGEILDAAQHLFVTKGYAKTTVVDILKVVGIAKGTFYYYFPSKEAVMDAVIARVVEGDAVRAARIAADATLPPLEKLHRILAAQQPVPGDTKNRLIDQFHLPQNAEMHQRSLVQSVRSLTPILERVLREGIDQGLFATPHPTETVEFLLVAGQILFDEGLFQWTTAQRARKAQAFAQLMERCLGAPEGSAEFMLDILGVEATV